jgi:tetratricopeptide (TPR) repeat protein
LTCFSKEEVEKMHLEQYGFLSNEKKAEMLIKILREKILELETPDQPLWVTNNAAWRKIMMGIGTVYGESGQIDEQIQVAEELIDKQEDKLNLSHQHALAALLVQRGDYERAEVLEKPCTEYMDNNTGKDSPQSMSSRRVLAKAIWMQGRQDEAEKLIKELFDLIEMSGSGKYAVYQEGENEMAEEMLEELKKKKPKT